MSSGVRRHNKFARRSESLCCLLSSWTFVLSRLCVCLNIGTEMLPNATTAPSFEGGPVHFEDSSDVRIFFIHRLFAFRCPYLPLPTLHSLHRADQSFSLGDVGLTRRHSPSPCPIHILHYVSHTGCILSSGEHCFLSRTLDFWRLTFRRGMLEIVCLIWIFH